MHIAPNTHLLSNVVCRSSGAQRQKGGQERKESTGSEDKNTNSDHATPSLVVVSNHPILASIATFLFCVNPPASSQVFSIGVRRGNSESARCRTPKQIFARGSPIPFSNFCFGDDRFWKKSTLSLTWCGDRPLSGRKGVIPCSCNLALGGASWYLCVRGLSASTALQAWGLARGCTPCLRRRRLPAASKIGEGILPRFDIQTREEASIVNARRTAGSALGGVCEEHFRTRSGGSRCRTGSGASLVSPRGTTMSVAIQHVRGHPAPTTGPPSLWRHQVVP